MEKETESNINNHKLQSEFEAQIEQLIQEKEALKNAFDENKRTIMQLEEEKTYNLMQFHNLKQEIDELKKEKNLKVEYFSKLIEEYEQKILYLEKEKTEFEISREKQEINHDSEKQESLFQRIKILESQIVENEDNKEKLQMHWLESHHILEEELKEFEKIKEEFIQVSKIFEKIKNLKLFL